MDLMTFLKKQIQLMESILDCLEREKTALIHEDASTLLNIIEEKKEYISLLEGLEEKRKEIYPNLNMDKMHEAGLLTEELQEARDTLTALREKVDEYQETNAMLTQQSLEYAQQMITILRGNKKPPVQAYGSDGKVGGKDPKGHSTLDQSV